MLGRVLCRFVHDASRAASKPLHVPVLLNEVVDSLNLADNSVVLDMTFGAGGHSEEILKRYPRSLVIAVDRDERAISLAKEMSDRYSGRVLPLLGKFSELEEMLKGADVHPSDIHAAIVDPGCSSMQLDEADRGFSLSSDGPLDMRMDGNRNENQITAADVVNHMDEKNLARILLKYGDEFKSKQVARSIVENRPIYTTKCLAEAVGNAFSYSSHMLGTDSLGRRKHAATKTFMALRIYVNDEINELYAGFRAATKYLCDSGRFAAITFHPLEDKLVKMILNERHKAVSFNNKTDICSMPRECLTLAHKGVIRPTEAEIVQNPRARSAKLRVLIKTNMKEEVDPKMKAERWHKENPL